VRDSIDARREGRPPSKTSSAVDGGQCEALSGRKHLAVTGTGRTDACPDGRDLSKTAATARPGQFDKPTSDDFLVNNRRLCTTRKTCNRGGRPQRGLFAIDLEGRIRPLIAAQFDFHQENTGSIIKSESCDDVCIPQYAARDTMMCGAEYVPAIGSV